MLFTLLTRGSCLEQRGSAQPSLPPSRSCRGARRILLLESPRSTGPLAVPETRAGRCLSSELRTLWTLDSGRHL